jgi:hypothetical protein
VRNASYARPIIDGIDATFGVTFSGRAPVLTVLGYVSVYCEAVHRLGAELFGKRFKQHDCATFGYPLNSLPPNKGETGIWTVDEACVDTIAHAIYRDSLKHGHPIWDAHNSIGSIAETVALPIHDILDWQRPAVYYLAGEHEQALAAARQVVEWAGEDAAHFGFDVFLQRLEERIESDRA